MSVWMTARGAGLAALVLLSLTVCAGAVAPGLRPRARVIAQYVHRASAVLGLGVIALHILTILADSYANVGVTGALVPFTSGYRATAVGLGTIAAYLMLFVSALGFARVAIASSPRGARLWRRLHLASYPAWALAMLHGFSTGTDSSRGWVEMLYLSCLLLGVLAITIRIRGLGKGHRVVPSEGEALYPPKLSRSETKKLIST